jgi:hypothetical protein
MDQVIVKVPNDAVAAAMTFHTGQIPFADAHEMLVRSLPILRRLWEAERQEQMCAEVLDISNARHLYVQRSVDRFIDRCNGNVSEEEIAKRYQQGVDQWNADHPALVALWQRHDAIREESKAKESR